MRKSILSLIVILFVLAHNLTYAQNRIELQKAVDVLSQNEPVKYKVDAQPYLEKFYKAIGFDPSKQERAISLRKAAWNFQVGTHVNWKAADFSTNEYYDVTSTCQLVGTNCYVFVEDAIWGSSVNQAAIDSVGLAFDSKTPANPSKGIYQTNVEVFGQPPDVDSDPKIIILILDIKDGFTGTGGYVAGYFSSVNEGTSDNSNKAEIYYLDGVQNNLTTAGGVQDAMSTTAHEFQHMLHYNSLSSATTFFNECFSLTAEIICGYPLYSPSLYAKESNRYLTSWRDDDQTNVLKDYSRAARFGLYLLEQYGTAFFKRYLEKGTDGINGVTNTIKELTGTTTTTLYTILPNWFMANYLNNKNIEPLNLLGYNSTDVVQMVPRGHNNPNVSYSGQIYNLAAEYITFTNGKNLSINFNNNNKAAIKIKAVKYGSGQPVVEDVAPNTDYSVPEFGTTYSKVTFMLYMVDPSPLASWGPYNYSYTATGTIEGGTQEIAYDTNEPVGYISLSVGDSVAVQFDAVSGAKLDSIRVAIRNLVPISGRVLEFLGNATQLGTKTLAEFTATSKLSVAPEVIDTVGEYPYPQPYPNWTTIDLRSFNLTADKDFVVEFPFEGSSTDKNKVLTTIMPVGDYHTFVYRRESREWGISGVQGRPNDMWVVLIRAYVSLVTDADEVIELLPTAYSLDQNYPNPFNPSTIISYQLPKAGNVQIKIFDALGREIRSLINEEKSSGKFNIAWDGRDNFGSRVSSGIYFYTISSGSFVETKKMVLMK